MPDEKLRLNSLLWDAEASVTDLEAEFGGLLHEIRNGNMFTAKEAFFILMSKNHEMQRKLDDLHSQIEHMRANNDEAPCDSRMVSMRTMRREASPLG